MSYLLIAGYGDLAGGGEATPGWLPEGVSIFLDFKGGHYYAGGAEKTLTDLAGDVPLFSIVFNPSDVVAGTGLRTTGAGLINQALSAFNGDISCVITGEGNFTLELTEETFTSDLTFRAILSGLNPVISDSGTGAGDHGSLYFRSDDLGNGQDAPAGTIKLGFTLTAASCFGALNGETLDYFVDPDFVQEIDPDTGVPFTAAKLLSAIDGDPGVIESIAIYSTVKNASELQALTA